MVPISVSVLVACVSFWKWFFFGTDLFLAPKTLRKQRKWRVWRLESKMRLFVASPPPPHTYFKCARFDNIYESIFFSLLKPCVHEIETNCIQHHVQHYHLLTATAASPKANVYNFVPSAKWIEMGVIFPDLFSQLLSQFFRRPKIQCRAPNPKWNRRRDFSTWNKDAVSSHSG